MKGEATSSTVDEIVEALRPIVKSAKYPLQPEDCSDKLLALVGVVVRSGDPNVEASRVKALGDLIEQLVSEYPEDALREAARIYFGIAPGNRGVNIGLRQERAAASLARSKDHFRLEIAPKILERVAWLLYLDSQNHADVEAASKILDSAEEVHRADPMSSEVRRMARQLYWWAQEALLYLLAYDHASRLIDRFRDHADYYEVARANISSRSSHSDHALWAFVHSLGCLRDLQGDDAGRDLLAERVPVWWQWRLQLYYPLEEHQIGEAVAKMAEVAVDEAGQFVDALLQDAEGSALHDYWLEVISSSDLNYGCKSSRDDMIRRLLEVVAGLQPLFPEQTRPQPWPTLYCTAADLVLENGIEVSCPRSAYVESVRVALDVWRSNSAHRDEVLEHSWPS